MGASSSSQYLEASPQPPASLGSPWKRLLGLLDTPAGHGGAGMGPLAGQPNLYRVHPSGSFRVHPSGSCLLHVSVLPQQPPSQGALGPASRAPGHLCPESQLIPEEAMQAERNFEILQATPFPPAPPVCCTSEETEAEKALVQGHPGIPWAVPSTCSPAQHTHSCKEALGTLGR